MERSKAELNEIGVTIRAALEAETDPAAPIRAARRALLERLTLRNATRSRGVRRQWLALGVCSTAAIAGTAAWLWARLPISFQVDGSARNARLGDVVEAVGAQPVALRFSEGSSIALRSGARVRVLATDRTGARVLVESGAMDVAIAHRDQSTTHWTFEAGSFRVLVTGTRFTVTWSPETRSLSLSTREGSVQVSGSCLREARKLSAGNTLDVSCSSHAPSAPALAAPPAAAAPGEPTAAARDGTTPQRTGTADSARRDDTWRELIAAGRLVDALRAAERTGFGRACQTATERELVALADTARLSGHSARAIEALGTLRRRFAGSREATTAAFSLGRIAFEQRGAYGEAVRWFGTYLDEAPNGPLMGDAVGRLMEARSRQGDRQGARADAERYLRRFPEGPYAAEARGILSE